MNVRAITTMYGYARCASIYWRYRHFTMIGPRTYARNLMIAGAAADVDGCVIECGAWRGGMSAGLVHVLGTNRQYFLFDSFEGLPPATDADGEQARRWQADRGAPHYYDNCRASERDARDAMMRSPANRFHVVKGWFADTVARFQPPCPIALLRLDGDWYESTLCCLRALYPHVAERGLIILDDYYFWDGCAKAVHHYLAEVKSAARIEQPFAPIGIFRKPPADRELGQSPIAYKNSRSPSSNAA